MKDRETILNATILSIVCKARVFLNLKLEKQADVGPDQIDYILHPDQPLSEFSRIEIRNMIDELKIQ